MEARYISKHSGVGISEALDFEKYFNDYGAEVFGAICRTSDGLAEHISTTEEEVEKLASTCRLEKLSPSVPEDIQLPYDGFRPNLAHQDVPNCALTLASLRALQRRSKDLNRKLNKNILRYRGEVSLEDEGSVKPGVDDLAPLQHYVVTVRIYLPGVHVKSSASSRTTFPRVSQEFHCLSSDHLVHLRDRIICSSDYQPTTDDVSDDPFVPSTSRTKDVNTEALFYLGNNFYIDTRNPGNSDCSQKIREWGAVKGYMLGNVSKMEETTWRNIKKIRLGYPYLYMHQKYCEHLIVLTDARLLHESDCMDSSKYPIMRSFANLQGKYCVACNKRPSKYLVIDNDKLPYKVANFCTICLILFNYVNGIKTGNFKVQKYVDRASLI